MRKGATESVGLVDKRPHFGSKQVRTLRGIKRGRIFFEKDGELMSLLIKISREPYQEKDGSWWVMCSHSYDHGKTWSGNQTLSLQDHNLFPYEGGVWNTSNWLKRR